MFWGDWLWPSRPNLIFKKLTPFWVCEFVGAISHNWLKSGFPNLDQKYVLALLSSLLILGLIDFDLPIYSWFQTIIYSFQTSRLICVILYILNEAIATECSIPHMAPHTYWFLCTWTGARHGQWNSLPLYLGETIKVQPTSTRQLALDFTSCYRF